MSTRPGAIGAPTDRELRTLTEETPASGPARSVKLLAAIATFGSLLSVSYTHLTLPTIA